MFPVKLKIDQIFNPSFASKVPCNTELLKIRNKDQINQSAQKATQKFNVPTSLLIHPEFLEKVAFDNDKEWKNEDMLIACIDWVRNRTDYDEKNEDEETEMMSVTDTPAEEVVEEEEKAVQDGDDEEIPRIEESIPKKQKLNPKGRAVSSLTDYEIDTIRTLWS